jgi:hypothetical protein
MDLRERKRRGSRKFRRLNPERKRRLNRESSARTKDKNREKVNKRERQNWGNNERMKRLRAGVRPRIALWLEGKARGDPTCELCKVVFKRKWNLEQHVRRSHPRALRLSREVGDMMDAWWRGEEVEWPDLAKASYKAKCEKKAAVAENKEEEVSGEEACEEGAAEGAAEEAGKEGDEDLEEE